MSIFGFRRYQPLNEIEIKDKSGATIEDDTEDTDPTDYSADDTTDEPADDDTTEEPADTDDGPKLSDALDDEPAEDTNDEGPKLSDALDDEPTSRLSDALDDEQADDAGDADTASDTTETDSTSDDETPEEGEELNDYTIDDDGDGDNDRVDDSDSDESTDYTDDFDSSSSDEGGDEDTGDSSSDDDNTDDSNADDGEVDKLKQLEDELFSNLTPEQISIKNIELKKNYIELYDTINRTINRVNKIPKSDTTINVIAFITEKLIELKDMVNFNITKNYKSKTYIENYTDYEQSLAILSTLNKILSEINVEKDEKDK